MSGGLHTSHDRQSSRLRLQGIRKQTLNIGRNRLMVTGVVFIMAFLVIAGRLVNIMTFEHGGEPKVARSATPQANVVARADIVDRNGVILATSLPTASLYVDAREVLNAEEAAIKLTRVLPELKKSRVLAKLKSNGAFIWLRRNLSPRKQYEVNRLGIPGLAFKRGERRVYPQGQAAAHVLGYTDVDGYGISGLEKQFNEQLNSGESLRLSIDLRVQDMLRHELMGAVDSFKAIGAAGMVLDVDTGETLAMVSLPDFDPNVPAKSRGEKGFNRVTKGVYEMGSTFKLFTVAMALDSGVVTLSDGYDASKPLHIARFTISDFHSKKRWLSVPEILVYSSNVGAALMALDVGASSQQDYLGRLGLLRPAAVELPEVGAPLLPSPWRKISTMTISYGHGIAVSPLQLASAVATVVNGGIARPVTLLRQSSTGAIPGKQALSAETSRKMRGLMRLVVRSGTGRKANVPGYRVGGKTGTAEKQGGGGYRKKALISSFIGAFPMDAPRYVVLVVIDEPKGNKSTHNYATGGWVAAPSVGRIVSRLAPLLGIAPQEEESEKIKAGISGSAKLASLSIKPTNNPGKRIEAQ